MLAIRYNSIWLPGNLVKPHLNEFFYNFPGIRSVQATYLWRTYSTIYIVDHIATYDQYRFRET